MDLPIYNRGLKGRDSVWHCSTMMWSALGRRLERLLISISSPPIGTEGGRYPGTEYLLLFSCKVINVQFFQYTTIQVDPF